MAAINFPANPSNGDTHEGFVYNSTLGVWQSAGTQTAITSFTGLSDTPSTLGTAGQIAKVNSGATALEFADQSGVTVYANVDALPGTGNTGDLAFVTATNRLYIWNGSGWYNIALINTNPTISGVSSSYALATDGTATVITITATDPEGLPITYSIASDTSGNIATVTQGTGANTNVFTITPSTSNANAGTFSLTFRASDGVNIATAPASFTLQFQVLNSNYTTALITSVGANNQVNNSFDDASTNNHTVTANGSVTQNTFSPYRHGGYSTYFDGTGDYLRTPSISLSGDFTIEGWFYPSVNDVDSLFTLNANTLQFYQKANGNLTVWDGSNTEFGVTLSPNTWYHIAIVRSSNVITAFVNGTAGSTTYSNSSNLSGIIEIGGFNQGSQPWNGYITDFRVIAGTAVYTSTFTPPTERLTAITNTSLLTCHLPYIADGSTNSHAITVNGNTKTEPFSPYDHAGYSTGDNGGSMYFDGSGDYLTVSNQSAIALGSGDFCVECWTYLNSRDNDRPGIWSNYGVGGFDASALALVAGHGNSTTTQYQVAGNYTGGSSFIINAGTILYKQWVHLAVVRNSGTIYLYVNGAQKGSASVSQNFDKDDMWVGITGDNTTKGINGYVSNFRVVVGSPVYTSAFTPPTAPLTAITNTSLLLNGTDAGIIDKSQSVKTITLNGDVKSSTTQSKYLTSSMYFDGTGDVIVVPETGNLFTFGTGDFTYEAWIYPTGTGQQTIFGRAATGNTAFPYIYLVSGSNLLSVYYSATVVTSSGAVSTNAWSHVAISRQSGTTRIFINGTADGSASDSTNLVSPNTFVTIGGSGSGASNPFAGYMSDVRITKGLARYTANFTPPTAELKG